MPSEADTLGHRTSESWVPGLRCASTGCGERRLWHQVVAGPFDDLGSARQGEARLRQLPGYADAHLIQH